MPERLPITPQLAESGVVADPDLQYPVPNGVDPAVVIDLLKRDGYDATEVEDAQHQPVVNIRRTGRIDREAVRSMLQQVPYREGDDPAGVAVRFSDE